MTFLGRAMNASRMRRPSAVRTGMFCRLGSEEASRPVTAVAWLNVVCTRPVRRFELRKRTMLEQDFRQRIICRKLIQRVLIGRRLAGRGLADRRQLHLAE